MEVKLATTGTAQFRFVSDPGFTWIGNTTVNGDDWTTVTGTFTPPAGGPVAVFIGSGPHSAGTSPYTYLVDDIVVSTETEEPPSPIEVVVLDFNDGTWGDWVQSGGPALSVVDDAGNGVLQVANRANDFDGIKSPAMFEAGVEYVFSMEVKLATRGRRSSGS